MTVMIGSSRVQKRTSKLDEGSYAVGENVRTCESSDCGNKGGEISIGENPRLREAKGIHQVADTTEQDEGDK